MQTKTTGMRQKLAGLGKSWRNMKFTKTTTFWIVVGAIILALYLGFSRGGWVTGGTSEQRSVLNAQTAVVARLAPICMAQFDQDPERDQKLVGLKELSSPNQRTTFVKEQGWATMPGETAPDSRVATECAKQLIELDG